MSDESLTMITCASSAFSPASVDVGVEESLLAMQSFADEVTVESLFGGVAPNRRNHGARGLLISACVSLRHMARIRPATVVAQSLASFWPQVPVNAVLQNLKQCICHGRLAKCQFWPQRAKVQEQICVFNDALLRVLAVGAVFNTRGTRDVNRQHLRQLSGIASESLAHSHEQTIVTIGICFVVFRTKIATNSVFIRAACVLWIELCCSWLSACGRMRSRGMCHEWYAKKHNFALKCTDLKNKNLSTPGQCSRWEKYARKVDIPLQGTKEKHSFPKM